MSFREPNGAVMTANMKPQGGRSIEALSLRGLQGRSATGQNGQAAKEEMSAIWRGAGCRKNISGVPAGRSVFHLTSPLIGLPGCSSSVHNKEALPRLAVCKCLDEIHD